jgi:hypothetical protein
MSTVVAGFVLVELVDPARRPKKTRILKKNGHSNLANPRFSSRSILFRRVSLKQLSLFVRLKFAACLL